MPHTWFLPAHFRMSDAAFDSMRIILIALLVLSRICLMPFFIQSFLNLAQDRLLDQRKQSGRILNTDLQKQVSKGENVSEKLVECYEPDLPGTEKQLQHLSNFIITS